MLDSSKETRTVSRNVKHERIYSLLVKTADFVAPLLLVHRSYQHDEEENERPYEGCKSYEAI